jgi:purine-binding chemotaxis protein CheW
MEPTTDKKNPPGFSFTDQSRSQGELQLVGFHVDGEEYGLDVLRVHEIIRVQHLTRVPDSGDFIDGVMNLRGRIVPVVALRRRFGLKPAAIDKQTRIIVVETSGTVLGFIVDSVSEVFRIPSDRVEPPPRLSKVDREYVSGVGKIDDRLLILLDVDRLLNDYQELASVAAAQV